MRDTQVIVCLSGKDTNGRDTVPWLEAKVKKYKPTIVFVDGMYLMTDVHKNKQPHERVASVSRDMRQMILRMSVPVFATVQANRGAAKNQEANLDEVAFSDSLGQDATMLIRCINEHKKGEKTIALVMGGACRRINIDGFRIMGKPATDFSYFGELSAKDAEGALRKDDESPGKDRGGEGKTPRRRTEKGPPKNEMDERAAKAARRTRELMG